MTQCPSVTMLVNGRFPKEGEFTEEELKKQSLDFVHCCFYENDGHKQHHSGSVHVIEGVPVHIVWIDKDTFFQRREV